MNTSLTAYTHLESLLLFQCLNTHGVNPPVFSKISELLKNNPHIAADKGFQSGRLSPDALRNFYLHILKEEIRSERQDGTSDTSPPNGEVRNSRKRKAPSPNLPTSQEAAQHAHLIPNLITKLYTRYRAAITEQIRDEENRIARLHKDCQSIERGEWDQQLQERANAKISASRSPSLPRRSPLLPQRSFPPSPSPHHAKQDVLGVRDASVPNGPRPVEQVPVESEQPKRLPDGQFQVEQNEKVGSDLPPLTPSNAQPQADFTGKTKLALSPFPPSNDQAQREEDARRAPNPIAHPSRDHQASIERQIPSEFHAQAERDGRDNWETHPLAHPNLQIPPDHVATLAPSTSPLPSKGHPRPSTATFSPANPGGQQELDPIGKASPKKSVRKKKSGTELHNSPLNPQSLPGPVLSPQPNQTPLQPLGPSSGFQSPQPASAGYNVSSQTIHRSPYPPQSQYGQAQISQGSHPPFPQHGTQGVQHAAPQSMQLPSSPHVPYVSHAQSSAVAPPASSMQFQSQPAQSYGGSGIPTYGSLSGAQPQMSPTHQRFPSQYQPGSQSPGVHTPLQQRNHHRYLGQQPFHTPQMGQSLPSGGVMLPPFQVSPQHPASSQPSSSVPNYPQMSTPVNVRQLPPSAASGRSGVPQMHNLVTQARQSFSTPGNTRTPNSAMFTPRSTRSVRSRLKSDVVNSPVVDRPNVQPIDDDSGPEATMSKQVQSKAKLPRKSRAKPKANENEAERGQHVIDEPEKEVEKDKTSGKGKERGKGKAKEKEKEKEPAPPPAPEESEEPVLEIETRQGRSRRKAPAIRRRLGSKASSQAGGSVRERSRSPSILSHTDTVTADNESQVGYQVKSEPGLANDVIDEDSATTRSQPSTRRRAAAPTLKRKRNAREASLAESEEQQPPTPELRTVVAARQFQKMSKPVLDDISSHQFSSLFTTAVKAKDAEGYYDIIKRPTDLNSIKKAIGAGTKVVQAVATDTPVGSPGGGGSVVEVPMTLEYIPPKAIVNPAQLEKELMRMFVNAVMFNAGEEGIVVDARSMFETVQQSVSSWRSIKHSSAKVVVEETPPVEEDAPIASKRRKL